MHDVRRTPLRALSALATRRRGEPPAELHATAEEAALTALHRLAEEVIDVDAPQAMGLYLFASEHEGAELALHVERNVFAETVAEPESFLATQYGPYRAASVLVCVMDHRRRVPAAMMRLILPSAAGLKSLDDAAANWGEEIRERYRAAGCTNESGQTWDIATLAIAPEYRAAAFQGLVTMGLCQVISIVGARCGFTTSVAILHVPVLRMLQWKLHRPFSEFPDVEPRGYLESPASLPVCMDLQGWHARLAQRDPVLHELMTVGKGLDPVLRPPDWSVAAELVDAVATGARRVQPTTHART